MWNKHSCSHIHLPRLVAVEVGGDRMTTPRKNISIMVGNQLVTYRVPVPLAEYIADLEGVQNVTRIADNLDEMSSISDRGIIDVIAKQRDDYGAFGLRMEKERDDALAWARYYKARCEELQREIEVLYALRSGRSCENSPFTSDNE